MVTTLFIVMANQFVELAKKIILCVLTVELDRVTAQHNFFLGEIMGFDYKCGCRFSMGHWFLCEHHEHMLLEVLEIL